MKRLLWLLLIVKKFAIFPSIYGHRHEPHYRKFVLGVNRKKLCFLGGKQIYGAP
jgi:hypothetical protein